MEFAQENQEHVHSLRKLFPHRDSIEAMTHLWSVSGEFLDRHHVMIREQLCVPKESSFPILLNFVYRLETTNKNLDNIIDDLWNIDGHRILIARMDRIHEILHPQQATTQRVDHG